MLKALAVILLALSMAAAVWVSTYAFEEKVVATVTTVDRSPPSSTPSGVTVTVTTPEITVTVTSTTLVGVTLPSVTLPTLPLP